MPSSHLILCRLLLLLPPIPQEIQSVKGPETSGGFIFKQPWGPTSRSLWSLIWNATHLSQCHSAAQGQAVSIQRVGLMGESEDGGKECEVLQGKLRKCFNSKSSFKLGWGQEGVSIGPLESGALWGVGGNGGLRPRDERGWKSGRWAWPGQLDFLGWLL